MIENIQLLRAFAAVNVVFSHSIDSAIKYGFASSFSTFFQSWGGNGVDIFFVISGFIMVVIQSQKKRSPSSFFVHRIKRIVPTYWFYCSLLVCVSLLVPSALNKLSVTPSYAFASLSFLSQFIFHKQPMVGPGWTLELEMLFYAIFSACLFFSNRVLSGLLLVSIMFFITLSGMVDFIFLEFLFGVVIGASYVWITNTGIAVSNKVAAVCFLIGCSGLTLTLFVNMHTMRVILVGIPAVFMVFGAVYSHQYKNSIGNYLGDASYSIYLFNWFFTPFFYKVFEKYFQWVNAELSVLLCVIGAVLGALLAYECIEKPLLKLVGSSSLARGPNFLREAARA